MSRTPHKLTEQQDLFVELYFRLNFDVVEAYVQSGYSPKTAHVAAYKMLSKPHIRRAIRERSQRYADRVAMSREEMLAHLEHDIRDRRTSVSDRTNAIRTLATMTGNAQPSAGDTRRQSLEDLRQADEAELMAAINKGYAAHAMPAAKIIEIEAKRETSGRK